MVISYIPIKKGFIYLTNLNNLKIRYGNHWSLFNSITAK